MRIVIPFRASTRPSPGLLVEWGHALVPVTIGALILVSTLLVSACGAESEAASRQGATPASAPHSPARLAPDSDAAAVAPAIASPERNARGVSEREVPTTTRDLARPLPLDSDAHAQVQGGPAVGSEGLGDIVKLPVHAAPPPDSDVYALEHPPAAK